MFAILNGLKSKLKLIGVEVASVRSVERIARAIRSFEYTIQKDYMGYSGQFS